eukprot:gene7329-8149_t
MDYKYLFKVILVGDAGVGKTAMVRRFTKGFFPFQEAPTIGVDMSVKTVQVDGEKIKFKIWDSAGQERFKSITSSYYRNADAAIVVYSVDNEESFHSLYRWTKELDKCGKENLVKIIVGNKSDLEEERRVSEQSAIEFALADNAAAVLECSAKENDNIELLFEALAKKLIHFTTSRSGNDNNNNNKHTKKKAVNYTSSDPSAERLITSLQENANDGKSKKFFKFPEMSSTCLRKFCGIL